MNPRKLFHFLAVLFAYFVPASRSPRVKLFLCLGAIALSNALPLSSMAVPQLVSHQGRISVAGINFDGTGLFKFAIVNAAGDTTFWSNDGSSTAGSEPSAAVSLTVTKGLYSLLLGDDALTNMTPLPASVFENDTLFLRIWFDDGTANASQQLTPDQRIASVGYALNADQAESVALGAVTTDMLADSAVTSAKISDAAVTSVQIAPGAVTALALADAAVTSAAIEDAAVSIRDIAPGAAGLAPKPIPLAVLKDGVDGFSQLGGARDSFVADGVAYVASFEGLTIIDVSDPSDPQLLSQTQFGPGGSFNDLQGASRVVVSGTVAYVTAQLTPGGLSIIDVSDPMNPQLLVELKDGMDGFNKLSGARGLFVDGSVAYVAAPADNTLTVIDVSTPATPQLITEIGFGLGGGFNEVNVPKSVFVLDSVAYVTGEQAGVSIIDMSTPSSPQLLADIRDNFDGFTKLLGADGIFVSGSTAYVASSFDDSMTIIDVSDPSNPVLLSEVTDGSGGFNALSGATGMFVSGTIACVVASNDDAVTSVDVSNPSDPKLIAEMKDGVGDFTDLEGAEDMFALGVTAYVAAADDGALTIIDLASQTSDLFTRRRIGVGTSRPMAELHVVGEALIEGDLNATRAAIGVTGGHENVLQVEEVNNAFIPLFRRIEQSTDTTFPAAAFRATHTGDMGDGFGAGIRFEIEDDSSIQTTGFIGGIRDGADNQGALSFQVRNLTGATIEGARLDHLGRFGIGRVPAANPLEVEGDASKTTAGSWLANSDRRIKTDVRELDGALEVIDRIRPVEFRYTDEYRAAHPAIEDRPYLNVIAQEFAEVFPQWVRESGETLPETRESILQVDTWPAAIYSIAAIRELKEIVEEKDKRIQELEKRLEKLERAAH